MLQRGRGAGYLAALRAPSETVWPMLVECVAHDPRWDSQVESRDEYYAALIRTTGMDLTPLQEHLKQNDDTDQFTDDTGLTVTTLGKLAARGNPDAVRILRDYVTYGNWWDWAVDELYEAGKPEYLEDIADIVCRRFPQDADLRQAVGGWYSSRDEPWKTLSSANARLARALAEAETAGAEDKPQRAPSPNYTALSVEELLSLCEQQNYRKLSNVVTQKVTHKDEALLAEHLASESQYSRALALDGLGKLGTPGAFGAVKSFIESDPEAKGFVAGRAWRAIAAMPSDLCLDLGRQWFQSDLWQLGRAGEQVLKNHATMQDVPLLRETVAVALDAGYMYRLSSALEALARFPGLGPLSEVERVFTDVQYFYARTRAAEAMLVTAPEAFLQDYAFECMWDCDSETRAIGCRSADLGVPATVERLKELSEDGFEEEWVREAARTRIAKASGQDTG